MEERKESQVECADVTLLFSLYVYVYDILGTQIRKNEK